MGQEGVAPDVITHNALVSSSEKCKQPEQALSVFQAMRRHVVAPDAITYCTLVSVCVQVALEASPPSSLEV